jgi:hypothetical protein
MSKTYTKFKKEDIITNHLVSYGYRLKMKQFQTYLVKKFKVGGFKLKRKVIIYDDCYVVEIYRKQKLLSKKEVYFK